VGIFFRSMQPGVEQALEIALAAPPKAGEDLRAEADRLTTAVIEPQSGAFYWGRLTVAIVLLVLIFSAGIVTSIYGISDWSPVLLHSFELILGLVLGLLGGEAASRR
jgi:hypothetical protein